MITKMRRLPDNEPFYSCDIECFKVFDTFEALKRHYRFHEDSAQGDNSSK
jgi:hypothetical protein